MTFQCEKYLNLIYYIKVKGDDRPELELFSVGILLNIKQLVFEESCGYQLHGAELARLTIAKTPKQALVNKCI